MQWSKSAIFASKTQLVSFHHAPPSQDSSILLFSPLPSLFQACLSRCRAPRREDTLMLSLLGQHNSTSLWGLKALTLPCLPAQLCSSSLSTSQTFPALLTATYAHICQFPCLPVQQVVGASRVEISGCIQTADRQEQRLTGASHRYETVGEDFLD